MSLSESSGCPGQRVLPSSWIRRVCPFWSWIPLPTCHRGCNESTHLRSLIWFAFECVPGRITWPPWYRKLWLAGPLHQQQRLVFDSQIWDCAHEETHRDALFEFYRWLNKFWLSRIMRTPLCRFFTLQWSRPPTPGASAPCPRAPVLLSPFTLHCDRPFQRSFMTSQLDFPTRWLEESTQINRW